MSHTLLAMSLFQTQIYGRRTNHIRAKNVRRQTLGKYDHPEPVEYQKASLMFCGFGERIR